MESVIAMLVVLSAEVDYCGICYMEICFLPSHCSGILGYFKLFFQCFSFITKQISYAFYMTALQLKE